MYYLIFLLGLGVGSMVTKVYVEEKIRKKLSKINFLNLDIIDKIESRIIG